MNSGSIAANLVIFGGGDATGTTSGTFNLNGGTLTTGYVFRGGNSGYVFNFNGGTITSTADQGDFLRANVTYKVLAGGAAFRHGGPCPYRVANRWSPVTATAA